MEQAGPHRHGEEDDKATERDLERHRPQRQAGEPAFARVGHALLALIALEIGLGGVVVVLAVPLWAGLVHQAVGILTFAVLSLLMWRALAPVPRTLGDPLHVRLSRA